jgi:L-ascorbate metabolism protein UlaG (beta-lactamase superfamily)
VHATPMAHGDDDRARGLAYVVRGDGPSVYLCGDGGYFSGFADVGARFAPDVALLPIAGFVPSSFRARHMSPLDALYAFEDLRARLLVPIHHGAFSLSYERLGEPARWLAQLVKERGLEAHVRALQPGESEIFVGPRAPRPSGEDPDEPEPDHEIDTDEPETAEHEAATTPHMPTQFGAYLREIAHEDSVPITL